MNDELSKFIIDDFNLPIRDQIKVNIPKINYNYYYALVRFLTDTHDNVTIEININNIICKFYDSEIDMNITSTWSLHQFYLHNNVLYFSYDDNILYDLKRKHKIEKIKNKIKQK